MVLFQIDLSINKTIESRVWKSEGAMPPAQADVMGPVHSCPKTREFSLSPYEEVFSYWEGRWDLIQGPTMVWLEEKSFQVPRLLEKIMNYKDYFVKWNDL